MPSYLRLALAIMITLGAAVLAGGATSAANELPVLTLAYSMTNTLTVVPAGGSPISAGSPSALVPPGTYQVVIIDDAADGSDPVHMFQFSGPGVSLLTDLQGGDDKSEIYAATLAPNSSYSFQDDDEPSLSPVVFQTTSTSAPAVAAGVSTTPAATSSTTSSGTASGSRSSNASIVGSNAVTAKNRGSLAATVSAGGKLSLTRGGKNVTTLKAGRYRITVADKSAKAGFVIQEIRSSPHTLTATTFVGTRTATLNLAPGQWFFYSSVITAKSYFSVVA